MPSRTDSSYSLTAHTSRSFTHLRVRRAWLQVILLLGFIQMILGILIVTLSLLVTTTIPVFPTRNSCPIWAGFPVSPALQGCAVAKGGLGGGAGSRFARVPP